MPYLGQRPSKGDENNFKILDDISSYTLTFDGSDATVVSAANDTITSLSHRFVQGQRVTYTDGDGSAIAGLTDATVYFIIKEDHNTIKLATSASNASNGVAVNITNVGSGSSHTLNVAFDGVNTKFKATHTTGQKARITRSAQLVISMNGVIQQPHDTATPSTGFGFDLDGTIVFSQAPVSSDVFWAHVLTNNNVTFDISDNDIDNFTGDGSTVSFNLSKTPPDNRNVLVTVDGVVQYPNDPDGTERSYAVVENVLTFSVAPALGTEVQVRHIGFAGSSSGSGSGGVTSVYGRTGAVVLKSTDNITVNDAAITGNATVTGNLTVNGTTTTLDTKLVEVDKIEVETESTNVAVAVTHNGSGDLIRLYDGASQVVTVDDTGKVGISSAIPSEKLDVVGNIKASGTINATQLDITGTTDGVVNLDTTDGRGSFIRFKENGTTKNWVGCSEGIGTGGDQDDLGLRATDNIIMRAGSGEKLRINSVGDILLGAHGSRIFDDSSGTNVVVDIYGGTTAGKRGILALGGRVGDDNGDIGTIQFLNENNSVATAASHNQSKLVSSIHVKSETSDGNSGSDSGGHLIFSTKPETGQLTERLRITSDGKVGINTATPGAQLEVKGSGSSDTLSFLTKDVNRNNVFWIKDGGRVGLHYSPFVINQDYNDTNTPSGTYFYVHHSSSPFIIKNDGKVGIGITNPGHKLEVNSGTDNEGIEVVSTDAGSYIKFADNDTTGSTRLGAVDNDFKIDVNSVERFRISSTGVFEATSGEHDGGIEILSENNNQSTRLRLQSKSSGGTAYNWYLDSARSADKFTIHDGTTSWLTILGTGEVGINDTSPIHQLSIGIDTATAWSSSKNISNTTNNDFIGLNIDNQNSGANPEVGIMFQAGASGSGQYTINCRKTGGNEAELIFRTRDGGSASKEVLKIDSGGRTKFMGTRAGSLQPEDTDSVNLYTKSTNNSVDRGSGISFFNHDNSDFEMGGTIQVAKENATADDTAAYMRFCTRPAGSSSNPVLERLRIDSNGRVLIGTTTEGETTADNLTIADSGNCGITIRSGTSAEGNIFFSDDTSGVGEYRAILRYEHNNEAFVIKTLGSDRLRIDSDGGTKLTRKTVGGQESIGNVNDTWWKVGTWAGAGVDAAARATITVLGANTHNSGNPAGGETKIYLSITGSAVYASFYSHTDHHQGVMAVAHKYDSSASSCEIWVKYSAGYSSNCCFADVTNGFFTGASVNTGSSSTPSGATLATSKFVVRTSDGTASNERLHIASDGKIHTGDPASLAIDDFNITATGTGATLSLNRAKTGNASDNDLLGAISFQSYPAGQGYASAEAAIRSYAETGQSGSAAPTNLIFYTKPSTTGPGASPNERLRITSTGKVGINDDDPYHTLQVKGANDTTFDNISLLGLAGTNAYDSGNAGAGINFNGKYNTGGNFTTLAQISGIKENTTNSNYDGALTFGTRNTAQGTDIERLRIDSSGRLKIGVISDHTQVVTHCPVYIRMTTDLTAANTGEGAANTGLLRIEETGSNINRYHGIELRNRQSGDIRFLNEDVNTSDRANLVLVMPSGASSPAGLHTKMKFNSIEDSIQIAGKGGATLLGTSDSGYNKQKVDVYISTITGVTAVNTGAGDEVAGLIRFEDTGSSSNRYHGIELRNRNSGDARILNSDEGATNKSSLVFATDNGSDIFERLRIASDGSIGMNDSSPDARIEIAYESETNSKAAIVFRGPNNKSGEMHHKYIHNGGTSTSKVVNLLEVTSWQSTNSRIFGVVKVMAVHPLSNHGNQHEGWFFKADDGSADTGTMSMVHSKGGSVGSLDWDGDTLRYNTPASAYLNMHVSVEYHVYDGGTVVFDTDSRSF